MAETPTADEIRKELEKQIADLRKEVSSLGKRLSARGEGLYEDLRDTTQGGYDTVTGRARGAARQIRDQAHAVTEVMRENPATTATVLSTAGLLGFVAGVLVAQLLGDNQGRR